MKTNVRIMLLITPLILAPFLFQPPVKAHAINNSWALLLSGFGAGSDNIDDDFSDLNTILREHYGFDDSNLAWQLEATSANLHSALTDWLASESDYGDLVFIFIASHGGGYNFEHGEIEGGGRIDADGDEGSEVYNAASGQWFGVDECLYFGKDGSFYWDDEMKQDLANIHYGRMIIFIVGCKFENSTEGCFSGGFIDDISGPRRIVITSANETSYSYGYSGRGFFSHPFIDALNPESPSFEWADENFDGAVSIGEAYWYALTHDPRVLDGSEFPWMDDDGDRLPTFQNGGDVYGPLDGDFARQTWLDKSMYTGNVADVNNDGIVNMVDVYMGIHHFMGSCDPYASEFWDPLLDINYDNWINMIDIYRIIQQFGWQKQ